MLRARQVDDKVVSLTDCLSFGPIASSEQRSDWLDAHVPVWGGWDWISESAQEFLDTISAWPGERLVWIAPRSACEQCGLQWYFERTHGAAGPMIIADRPIQFKRVTAVSLGLGELAPEYMDDLYCNAPRRDWAAERASPDEWQRLRAEDTLLRIVDQGVLRSVPPTYFDQLLLDRCTADWQKWSRAVGWAMVDAMDQGHHLGDAPILWRLRELIKAGRLECRGELPGQQHDVDHRPNAELRRIA